MLAALVRSMFNALYSGVGGFVYGVMQGQEGGKLITTTLFFAAMGFIGRNVEGVIGDVLPKQYRPVESPRTTTVAEVVAEAKKAA